MKNTNLFFYPEFMELAKKNFEFTLDLFKKSQEAMQVTTKDRTTRYFSYINDNLKFIEKAYTDALATGNDIAVVYRENLEKTYQITSTIVKDMEKEYTKGA